MKPAWNTPSGGDFVRYVEQLTARAGQPRPAGGLAQPVGAGLERDAADRSAVPADSRLMQDRPGTPAGASVAAGAMRWFFRSLLISWASLLLVLVVGGAFTWVLIVLGAGLWAAFSWRHRLLPPGGGGSSGLARQTEDLTRPQAKQTRSGKNPQ